MGFGSMLKDYLNYYKISQKDFALRLGISVKHLNEILNDKTSLTVELMQSISLLTKIDLNLILYTETKSKLEKELKAKFKTEKEINKYLNSFYLNDMAAKKWLVLKDKTSSIQKALDLLEYLNIKDFNLLDSYINQKILYKKKDNANLRKIYLWIKHCDQQIVNEQINEYKGIDKLLEELAIERTKKFNSDRLIKLFNKHGIYLVIEDALEGTKIRGCMMVKGTNPAIYLTKYFKELSSLYYTLYHELCHIKSEYNKAKSKVILNDDEQDEKKCDDFALEQMIPKHIWKTILDNYDKKDEICLKNNIPLSFLYSR